MFAKFLTLVMYCITCTISYMSHSYDTPGIVLLSRDNTDSLLVHISAYQLP